MCASRAAMGSRVGVALCLVYLSTGCQPQPVVQPETPAVTSPRTTEELIAFVERAAAVVQAKGSDAFPELGSRPSIWSHDDTYLFIAEAGTNRIVVHGADRSRIGADLTTLKGAEGRSFGRWGLEALATRDHAWIFYKRARPRGGAPVWKASYLKRVETLSGESYIVGSGVYDLQVDRRFVTELVDMAVARLQEDGHAALKLIRQHDGPFVYLQTQVFVINTRGDVLADPLYPELERRNQINLKSADGRPIQRDLVQLIETESAGWRTGYLWPRPGSGKPGHKDIYMRRVELKRETLGVGSGLYVD
jgi:signal transduction histidine kinase